MWTVFRFCLFGALVAAASAADAPVSKEMANAVELFSLDLFKELASSDKNVVVSPVSVSTLLGLLQQGAEGETQTQLTKALHSTREQSKQGYKVLSRNLNSSGNLTLEFANAAFLNTGYQVKQAFRDTLEKDFLSSVDNVAFANAAKAADTINAWVAQHTHNRITHLVSKDSFDALTRFVLTNAVYFKGLWVTKFNKDSTEDRDFFTKASTSKKVPTMYLKDHLATGDLKNLNGRWLSLPFQGDRFSLLIILPNEVEGLNSVLQGLNAQELSRVMTEAKSGYKPEVILHLPRFKLASTLQLNEPLMKLGLQGIFQGANFSGISSEPVEVSKVIQKAEMEVNEEGAIASAATAIIVGLQITSVHSPPPVPLEFFVDHPYIAFIIDGLNGVPLFASKVSDPTTM